MKMCDLVIPIWNQLSYTRSCLDHIFKNTRYPFRLVLIDNGSLDETKQYLEGLAASAPKIGNTSFGGVRLIRNETNTGFVKAVNQGLRVSDAPYVCVLNNDTVPALGWFEEMIGFAQRHPDIGLINPQCDGHGAMDMDEYAGILARDKDAYMEMNQCQGFCMLMRRELIERIGLLDEAFGIGGYDDTDYSMRAHLAGYRCASMRAAYVYHRLHGSFDVSGDREAWVIRNRKIYYGKWGRHLRVGIIVDATGGHAREAISRATLLAYGLAREWSWPHIWVNSPLVKSDVRRIFEETLQTATLAPHQNIRLDCFNLPRPVFSISLSIKVLERLRKRMRDKAFDVIIGFDDASLAGLRPALSWTRSRAVKVTPPPDTDWLRCGKETALSIKAAKGVDHA